MANDIPYHWEDDVNQFQRAKYNENKLVSIKHSVCSWTPYVYKERKDMQSKEVVGEVNWTRGKRNHLLTMPIQPKTLRIMQSW
jgi:hypothetical protein